MSKTTKRIINFFIGISCFAAATVISINLVSAEVGGDVNRPIRDKWALVIGISEFANAKLNLQFPAKDAQDFARYLTNEAGFAPDHVKVLINKEATQRRILSELGNKWLPHVANPDDLVVLFISTHGSGAELDVGGQNYLLAYDTDVEDLYTSGIPMQKLAMDIKERIHCDRVVIFLDACHSGATTVGGKGLFRSGVDANEFAAGSGQLVITSSKQDQVSWESKSRPNGVFTASLLDSLRLKNGKATLGEVYDRLKDRVQDTVLRERGVLQTPVLKSQWQGNELVLGSEPTNRQPGLVETPAGAEESTISGTATREQPTNLHIVAAVPSPPLKTMAKRPTDHLPASPPAPSESAAAASQPTKTFVTKPGSFSPGTFVGRIHLGMKTADVLKTLGKPHERPAPDVFTYRSHDHMYVLGLHFVNDSLSDIAFTSPIFCSADGINLLSYRQMLEKFEAPVKMREGTGTLIYLKSGGFAVLTTPSSTFGVVTNARARLTDLQWLPKTGSFNATAVATGSIPITILSSPVSSPEPARGPGPQAGTTDGAVPSNK